MRPYPRRRRQSGRTALRTIALAVAALFLVGVILTIRLFIWPPAHIPQQADAVFVLSGDHGERLAKALWLIDRGVAPVLVLDGQPDFDRVRTLCAEPQPFEVVCLRPQPDSTRAEARAGRDLVERRRWRRIVVVTTTAHVTRAGLWFRRCLDATVSMVKAHRDPTPRSLAHEWLGLTEALVLERGC